MIHLPILRAGRPYRSLDVARLSHVATGEPIAEVSQANHGLIVRDLGRMAENRRALAGISTGELLALCRRAAAIFSGEEIPLGDGGRQSPEDFVRDQSATTGMPRSLCRSNMEKIRFVLAEMERILGGLTRGLDLSLLDSGYGEQGGRTVSCRAETDALGAVLPSNSPGVHSLWIPALALKIPVVLKPGSREPWTPFRIARSLQEAGMPREAVSYYPTGHAGGAAILLRTGRSMLFGDERTLDAWRGDPRVQLHGPGWSKVLLDDAAARSWEDHLDVMETSIAANGGRSCVNASGVWAVTRGREIAEGLAERLAAIEALPLDDPDARIAAFSEPRMAHAISDLIDRQLEVPGAEDLTARVRGGSRVVEVDGCTFLLPTVIWCALPEHPLAATELLFPFVSVVEVKRDQLLSKIGPTLVASVPTDDEAFREELLDSPDIERLNLGPFPTTQISWDQPHEGNLFQHLYRQRAVQAA